VLQYPVTSLPLRRASPCWRPCRNACTPSTTRCVCAWLAAWPASAHDRRASEHLEHQRAEVSRYLLQLKRAGLLTATGTVATCTTPSTTLPRRASARTSSPLCSAEAGSDSTVLSETQRDNSERFYLRLRLVAQPERSVDGVRCCWVLVAYRAAVWYAVSARPGLRSARGGVRAQHGNDDWRHPAVASSRWSRVRPARGPATMLEATAWLARRPVVVQRTVHRRVRRSASSPVTRALSPRHGTARSPPGLVRPGRPPCRADVTRATPRRSRSGPTTAVCWPSGSAIRPLRCEPGAGRGREASALAAR